MNMVKSVFYGFGAFVGRIEGETRCAFWSKNPVDVNFDPVLLVPVDLSRTPSAARERKIEWDEIQVDDHREDCDDGVTTIGPWFPDGKTTGGIYLAKSYWQKLRPEIRPEFPPDGDSRAYEFMTVVYRDGTAHQRAGIRYHGYHAKIVTERGNSALVAVHHAGCSQSGDPPIECSFDLLSPDCDAHVQDGGMTEIGLAPGKKKEGALFIRLGRAREIGIREVKRPPGHLSGFDLPTPAEMRARRG